MKMKRLSEEHYIICDDSEIKEGDWIGFPNLKKFVPVQYFGGDLTGGEKKITHSTQPLGFLNVDGFTTANLKPDWSNVKFLPLSEVKELLGVVDVEKKANDCIAKVKHNGSFIRGYNQALEDNKERKYTREDLLDAFTWGFLEGTERRGDVTDGVNKFSQSLQPKTEWEVKFVDGKLKLKQ